AGGGGEVDNGHVGGVPGPICAGTADEDVSDATLPRGVRIHQHGTERSARNVDDLDRPPGGSVAGTDAPLAEVVGSTANIEGRGAHSVIGAKSNPRGVQ